MAIICPRLRYSLLLISQALKKIAIIAIVLSAAAIAGEIFIFATQKEDSDEVQQRAIMHDYRIYAPPLPDTLSFAGEQVPMETYYVREALDKELITTMYRQSNTLLCLKRANRFFPVIEPILKECGVPDDFKYLCVIESSLTNATSPAKAQGFWQFVPATGKSYGLFANDEVDMRNDLEASTRAACLYLKKMHAQFGSWSATAAAYNCGENGLARRFEAQRVEKYYDLRLNTETSRYVYRILAMKLVMENPRQYGFHVRRCDLYPPIPTRTATLAGQKVDLYQFARDNGTTYKMLRELNPWLLTDNLANRENRTYTVKLPVARGTLQRTLTKGRKDTSLL